MWTHQHSYSKDLPVSEEIKNIARLEIAQSLKFGRTIAIIGSGVSAAYGHLNWDELNKFIILDTIDKANEFLQRSSTGKKTDVVKKLVGEIIEITHLTTAQFPNDEFNHVMLQKSDIKLDTTLLQLCRLARKKIGEPENELDETVRRIFSDSSVERFKARLRCVSYHHYQALHDLHTYHKNYCPPGFPDKTEKDSPFQNQWRKKHDCSEQLITALSLIYAHLVISPQSLSRYGNLPALSPDASLPPSLRSILEFIKKQPNIFLDDNKGENIKKEFLNDFNAEDSGKAFNVTQLIYLLLCDIHRDHYPKEYSYLRIEEELFGKLSVNPFDETNPGGIFNFVLQAFVALQMYDNKTSRYKLSGFNVTDDDNPYNIIIRKMGISRFVTLNYDEEIESAFVRMGFRKNENHGQNFEHAGHFTDGYGALLTSRAPTENSVSDLLVFSSTTTESSATIFHLHGAVTSATQSNLVLSEEDYQNQYLKGLERRVVFDEGLRTLFGGNDILFIGVGMSEADLMRPLRQYLAERPKFPRQTRTLVALKEYKTDKAKQNERKRETVEMKLKYDLRIIGYDNDSNCSITFENTENALLDFTMRCECYENRAKDSLNRAKLLCDQLEDLVETSQDWWEAWQLLPKARLARWNCDKNSNCHSRYYLEQIPRIAEQAPNGDEYFLHLKNYLKDDLVRVANNGANVLRFSAPRGFGKGNFVLMLKKTDNHGDLFSIHNTHEIYIGSFFADAHFSTEFNSVISAFGAFLFDTLAKKICFDDSKLSDTLPDNIDGKSLDDYIIVGDPFNFKLCRKVFKDSTGYKIGRLYVINSLFALLNKILSEHDRILICLSGLDRICNSHGYGYNPLHRSFFRLLRENCAEINTVNYHLVLVSGEPSAPIRYLSNEYSDKKPDNDIILNDTQQDLEPWNRLPKFSELNIESFAEPYKTLHTQITNEARHTYNSASKNVVFDFAEQCLYFKILLNLIASSFKHHIAPDIPRYTKNEIERLYRNMYSDLEYIISGSESEKFGVIGVLLSTYSQLEQQEASFPGIRKIQSVLKHLALFSYPVENIVISQCPEISELWAESDEQDNLEKTLDWLHERGFIFRFQPTHKDSGHRHALHKMIREYLADKMQYAIYDRSEHSFFDVSLFADQPRDLPSPSYKDYAAIQNILNSLIRTTSSDLKYNDDNVPEFLGDDINNVQANIEQHKETLLGLVNMLRAGVHLMNTAFSIGVVSRMDGFDFEDLYEENSRKPTPFERYCDSANALLYNAVRVDRALDILAPNHHFNVSDDSCQDARLLRVYYPTQIAWLYNEQAVTRFIQGRLYESLALFDLAIKTLKETNWSAKGTAQQEDFDHPENSSLRRVLLNKSVALIEFGEIDAAKTILQNLFERCKSHDNRNSLTAAVAGAYLGLCSHLRGEYDDARSKYQEALKKLEVLHSRERTKALVYKFLGDLDRTENQFKKARRNLELAANLAESVHQRDVYHQVLVSIAKLSLREGNYLHVFDTLKNTEVYARKLGVSKLLVDCWIVRGLVNLNQNQTTIAGEYLSHAIATSNRNGLILYKVAALHMYCNVLEMRNTDDARHYAERIRRAAKIRSERIGYPFKMEYITANDT